MDFKNKIQRSYLARDFDSFKSQLLQYARTFFPDKIQDFSEANLGGLLLDMPAFVGDTMSFYMDHQFNELDPLRARELLNIENHLKNAKVKIIGKSPASTSVTITIFVDGVQASDGSGRTVPDATQLPLIFTGTRFQSTSGISFTTVEDINFAELDFLGQLKAVVTVQTVNSNGSPSTFSISRNVTVTAAIMTTETFAIEDVYLPFRTITLSKPDVSTVMSVIDSDGNEYYEVEDLTHDTVFKFTTGAARSDVSGATASLEVVPAPYRFTVSTALATRLTAIRFGSGDGKSVQNDAIEDPSELALPLVGTTTFSKYSLDPNTLLRTSTLGVTPRATTLTVTYLSGGGLNTNVGSGAITQILELSAAFPSGAASAAVARIRSTAIVSNRLPATGGLQAPTVEELQQRITSSKNSQSRIVNKDDLLSRVYTIPSMFGRVFRASIGNTSSILTTDLYILSRDQNGYLTRSSDTLKLNLRKYLNEFRLINSSINIKDARIINFGLDFTIKTRPNVNKLAVLQTTINNLRTLFRIENMQIDKPINEADIIFTILNTQGVMALPGIKYITLTGDGYSSEYFDLQSNIAGGQIIPPVGSIFELKYPDTDIIGSVI